MPDAALRLLQLRYDTRSRIPLGRSLLTRAASRAFASASALARFEHSRRDALRALDLRIASEGAGPKTGAFFPCEKKRAPRVRDKREVQARQASFEGTVAARSLRSPRPFSCSSLPLVSPWLERRGVVPASSLASA